MHSLLLLSLVLLFSQHGHRCHCPPSVSKYMWCGLVCVYLVRVCAETVCCLSFVSRLYLAPLVRLIRLMIRFKVRDSVNARARTHTHMHTHTHIHTHTSQSLPRFRLLEPHPVEHSAPHLSVSHTSHNRLPRQVDALACVTRQREIAASGNYWLPSPLPAAYC